MFLISCTGRFILKFILNSSFPTKPLASLPRYYLSRKWIESQRVTRYSRPIHSFEPKLFFFPNHEILERTENCFKNFPWNSSNKHVTFDKKKYKERGEGKRSFRTRPTRECERMMQEYRWSEATSYRWILTDHRGIQQSLQHLQGG